MFVLRELADKLMAMILHRHPAALAVCRLDNYSVQNYIHAITNL